MAGRLAWNEGPRRRPGARLARYSPQGQGGQRQMNEPGPQEDRLIGRNAVSIRVRWLGLAGFLALAVGTYAWQAMPVEIGPLLAICGAFAAENLFYEIHLRYVRARGRLPFSKTFTEWQSLPDFALLALVVHFTGGVDSPYLYLSLLSLLMSGSLIPQSGVVLTLAAVSTSLTSMVVFAELAGVMRYHPFAPGLLAEPYAPAGYVFLSLGVYAVMMFVTAFGMVFLSQLLRQRGQELRESEERYRDLVENIGDLVFIMDTEGRLTFVNHTVEGRTGYSAKELLGQPVSAFLAPESLGVFQEAAERGFGKGLPVRGLRVVGLTKDGQRFHLEVNMSRIRRQRRVVGARGVARDITDRKQLEDELSQRLTDIARLYEASAQLSASLSLEETLQAVVRQAVEATHGVWAGIILVDFEGRPQVSTAIGDSPNLPPNQVMRPNGVSARVIASREPAIFPSTRAAASQLNEARQADKDRAAVCLPLLDKGRAMGVMWVNYAEPRPFSSNDVQLLRTFADQITSAIRNARLYAREQHRARLLEAVSTVGREAVSSLDLDTLLARTVSMLNRDLMYPFAAILLLDERGAELLVRASASSFDTALPDPYRQPVTLGLGGQAAREGVTVMENDVSASANYLHFFPETKCELDIPLMFGGTVMGVIDLQSDQPLAFPHEDVAVLETLASQIAIAINNARLYQEVAGRAQATTIIQEASMAMTATLTSDQVLEAAIRAAMRVASADMSSIYLVAEGHPTYEKVILDASGHLLRTFQTRSRRGLGLTGLIERERRLVVIEDTSTDDRVAFLGLRENGIVSSAGVPMMVGDTVLGILFASSFRKGAITDQHAQSLSILANSAAVALANAQSFMERERALAELSALNQIAQAIGSAMELEQVLAVIREQAGRLIDNDNFFIALYDEAEDTASFPLAVEDGQRVSWAPRRGGQGLTEYVIRSRQPLLIRGNLQRELARRGIDMILTGWEPQGWLGVPLLLQEKVVGVMAVQSRQPERFDESHERVLVAVGSQAAIAIEKARLLQDAVRKTRQLTSLYEVGKRTSALMSDADSLLPWIAEEAARLLRADAAGFRILQDGYLVLAGRTASAAEIMTETPIPVGQSLSGRIVASNEPIASSDISVDPRANLERRQEAERKGYLGFLGIPMRLRGQPVGVLNVYARDSRHWSQADTDLLFAFADQAAIAMENTRLYQALRDQARMDSLTQVYNHGYLLECLRAFVDEGQTPVSMIMLDVDHFKVYNDRYGHVSGDLVLKGIVQAIRQNIHRADVVGRWGGEEFGVLLPHTNGAKAQVVAERIRHTLSTMPLVDSSGQNVLKPTVSQGIATYPDTAASGEDLVNRADAALYAAKAGGRDRISISGTPQPAQGAAAAPPAE
jgi:diguanylate cyclase (GGDEF)-like protein/PAS domain S-box-containing protein